MLALVVCGDQDSGEVATEVVGAGPNVPGQIQDEAIDSSIGDIAGNNEVKNDSTVEDETDCDRKLEEERLQV